MTIPENLLGERDLPRDVLLWVHGWSHGEVCEEGSVEITGLKSQRVGVENGGTLRTCSV